MKFELITEAIDNDERGLIILDNEGTLVFKNKKTDNLFIDEGKNYITLFFEKYIEPKLSNVGFSEFVSFEIENKYIIKIKKILFQGKNYLLIFVEEKENISGEILKECSGFNFFSWKAEIKDLKFHYSVISDGFEKITGYKKEDLIKGKITFTEIVYEKDWPVYEEYLLNVLTGTSSMVEYRIKKKDETIVNLMEQAIPVFDKDGNISEINGFAIEKMIDDSKKSFSNAVFDALNYIEHSIIITDTEGTILYVNPAFTKITGFSYEEAIGENPRILKSGKHDTAFYENLWTTIKTGKIWDGEIINKTKKGDYITQELTITPIQNRFGEILYFLAIIKDITEKQKIERQLYNAQKLEAIGSLAGGIAHSFNNILAGILGYTDILKKRNKDDDEIFPILDKMTEAGEKASKLVSHLLGYARKGKMVNEIINLNSQIKDIVEIISDTAPDNIEIETIFESENSYTIGDPSQIKQVLMNITVNAIEAMPEGGRLTYHLYKRYIEKSNGKIRDLKKEGEYIVIAIEDTGIGIKEEDKNRVFVPFFTTKKQNKSVGLGLSTVYGIMKNHKGHVNFDSKKGLGTIFYLYFPITNKEYKKLEQTDKKNEKINTESRLNKILVVDDDDLIREMLYEVLSDEGYEVLKASDGEEGLEVFNNNMDEISLVILDMKMPKKNGRELFFDMKRIKKDLEVIIITGYTLDNQVQELLDNGASDYFKKPFDISLLLEKIKKYIN